ncbi:WecB/TagA/CpsF family glycosyltransferase [bacterium]|nr:WecB/TagA/CpsF family glycosyltransferase [bacterium]
MERKTKKVLGYDVDLISFKDAVEKVLSNINAGIGMQIVTINPEMIELANNNDDYANVLKNAELVIPDGSGIKLALKLKGIVQEQIPGVDFSKELIKHCADKKIPVAFVGAKEEVVNKTCSNIKKEFQELNICYFRNGYFSNEEEEKIISELASTKPGLILVALGAPKQEYFITECRKYVKNAAFIGVGGSFDVWAGNVERAPEIYRKMGCEWLYRTIKQPERIKRIYKTLPMFLIKAIMDSKNN